MTWHFLKASEESRTRRKEHRHQCNFSRIMPIQIFSTMEQLYWNLLPYPLHRLDLVSQTITLQLPKGNLGGRFSSSEIWYRLFRSKCACLQPRLFLCSIHTLLSHWYKYITNLEATLKVEPSVLDSRSQFCSTHQYNSYLPTPDNIFIFTQLISVKINSLKDVIRLEKVLKRED